MAVVSAMATAWSVLEDLPSSRPWPGFSLVRSVGVSVLAPSLAAPSLSQTNWHRGS